MPERGFEFLMPFPASIVHRTTQRVACALNAQHRAAVQWALATEHRGTRTPQIREICSHFELLTCDKRANDEQALQHSAEPRHRGQEMRGRAAIFEVKVCLAALLLCPSSLPWGRGEPARRRSSEHPAPAKTAFSALFCLQRPMSTVRACSWMGLIVFTTRYYPQIYLSYQRKR
jgi:hypothetical protein